MTSKFYFYNAHGLIIKSSILLPGLSCEEGNSDIIIRFEDLDSFKMKTFKEHVLSKTMKIRSESNNIHVLWHDNVLSTIQNSNEIILNSSLNLEENFFRIIILGLALPILLHKRGMLSLHANTVNMNGSAAAFIGPRGIGKSTTSIALQKKGYTLLSDDVSCIIIDNGHIPTVFSGFPIIKLWPEVIRNIGGDPDSMPKIHSNLDKRFYENIKNFSEAALPLKAIYLIQESMDSTYVQDMPKRKAVIELVKSTLYAQIFDNMALSKNLNQCSKIVNSVPVKALNVKRSLNDLEKLVEVIENDFFDSN
jgi:hypothetical protein